MIYYTLALDFDDASGHGGIDSIESEFHRTLSMLQADDEANYAEALRALEMESEALAAKKQLQEQKVTEQLELAAAVAALAHARDDGEVDGAERDDA